MEQKVGIKNGRLHCHSENSCKDGMPSVKDMCKMAASMGARALALTDHGTVCGWWSFQKAAQKEGIKPIFGVEGYVKSPKGRLHIILLAKDDIGCHAISLLVTESNKDLVVMGKNTYPQMTKEMIRSFVGPGSEGYGHIVMTSACINGILAGVALESGKAKKEIEKLQGKLSTHNEASQKIADLEKRLDEISKELEEVKAVAATKGLAKREANIRRITDPDEQAKAMAQLEETKKNISNAMARCNELSLEKKKTKKDITAAKKGLQPQAVVDQLNGRINELSSVALDDAGLRAYMEREALDYEEIAGKGNFYIELQYHYSPDEAKWEPVLDEIAHQYHIPVIAANDEHMLRREDTEARKYLNALRYVTFKWEDPSVADYELYYKTDEELTAMLCQIIAPEHVQEAMDNIGVVIDQCNAELPCEEAYPVYEQAWTYDETCAYLEKLSRDGIPEKYSNWTAEMEERLKYELGIIESMHFANYFLVVRWYVNVGRKLGRMPADRFAYLKEHVEAMTLDAIMQYIDQDQSAPGETIGPGRGSGAGSIVCYLLGITSIDPMKYHLMFERFLNPQRVSMPDIDVDFANCIREMAIEIVRKKYGKDGVACIMTRGTLAAKAAILNVAKVYGSRMKNDPKYFLTLGSEMSALVPKKPGIMISDCEADIVAKFGENPDAMEILRMAKQIEGTYIQTGMHAAGIVIVNNGDIRQYTPLMWDPKKKLWKTQMDKDEVEKHKMLKMDFLGLINLDIITDCLRLIQSRHPEIPVSELDPEHFPIKKEVIEAIYATGDTDSIFQFESNGMKSVLTRFHPESIEQLAMLNALYRPGPMQFTEDILAVKNGMKPLQFLCPQLEPILSETYGAILYQEQVMDIFKQLAGYDLGGADLVRRAMGHKQMEILQNERQSFIYGDPSRNIHGCIAEGISEQVANTLFDQMMAFASYAFNKSHAVAYTMVSYQTAYLKYYFPSEYFCTVMAYEEMKKMPALLDGCKKRGIAVHTPDINRSEVKLTVIGSDIYFGFGSVLGVAGAAGPIVAERNAHGEYKDIPDFLNRTTVSSDVFVALAKAGTFDTLNGNRKWLADNAKAICDAAKALRTAEPQLVHKLNIKTLLETGRTADAMKLNNGKKPNMAALERQIASLQSTITDSRTALNSSYMESDFSVLERLQLLQWEKAVLGVYVSESPLSGFEPYAVYENQTPIGDMLQPGSRKLLVLAYPEKIEIMKSKKSGKEFGVGTVVTQYGTYNAVCFSDKALPMLKQQTTPFILGGKFDVNKNRPDEEPQFYIDQVFVAKTKRTPLKIEVRDITVWLDLVRDSSNDHEEQQYTVNMFIDAFGNMVRTPSKALPVSEAMLKHYRAEKRIGAIDRMRM